MAASCFKNEDWVKASDSAQLNVVNAEYITRLSFWTISYDNREKKNEIVLLLRGCTVYSR